MIQFLRVWMLWQTKRLFQGILALVCSYPWAQFVVAVGLKDGIGETPFLELEGTVLL